MVSEEQTVAVVERCDKDGVLFFLFLQLDFDQFVNGVKEQEKFKFDYFFQNYEILVNGEKSRVMLPILILYQHGDTWINKVRDTYRENILQDWLSDDKFDDRAGKFISENVFFEQKKVCFHYKHGWVEQTLWVPKFFSQLLQLTTKTKHEIHMFDMEVNEWKILPINDLSIHIELPSSWEYAYYDFVDYASDYGFIEAG